MRGPLSKRGTGRGDGRTMEKLSGAFANLASDDLLLERLDIIIEAEAKRVTDAAVARFARIHVLVNSAGYSLLGNFVRKLQC